jgi:cell division septum initiation protein DivIVA
MNELVNGEMVLPLSEYDKLVEENDCLKAKILYLEGQITGMKEATYQRFISSAKRDIKKMTSPTKRVIKQARLIRPRATELDISMAKRMAEGIRNVVGETARTPSPERWAEEIRIMRDRDKLLPSVIMETFIWANRDSFWKSNILSPKALRKHWDKLRAKIQTTNKFEEAPRSEDNLAYIKNRMDTTT